MSWAAPTRSSRLIAPWHSFRQTTRQHEARLLAPKWGVQCGAIALGHPLGATSARLVLTALRGLERRQGRYALVTLCIGLGQGMAVVLERI